MRKIKAALDPSDTMNPGKVLLMSDLTQTDEIALAKLEPITSRQGRDAGRRIIRHNPGAGRPPGPRRGPRRRDRLGRSIRKFPDAWGGKPRAPDPRLRRTSRVGGNGIRLRPRSPQ